MVTPLSVTFPVTVKCASLRFDCCGLASTSFALGAGPRVGTPQPVAAMAANSRRTSRRVSLAPDHLRRRRCRDPHAGVELIEGQGQRIDLLRQLVLHRVSVALAYPPLGRVAILVRRYARPGRSLGTA